jgi:endonuclease YncB( thermonuclease family)
MYRTLVVAFALSLLALVPSAAEAQKKCVKGKPCGNTCIAVTATCRVGTGSATSGTSSTTPSSTSQAKVPDGMQYVASTRGTTYYHVGCSGWKSLSAANLRWFKTVEEARAAGLRPSAQAGCAGPATPPAATPPQATAQPGVCSLARVIDGDTVECLGGTRVRLLLIDAPEMGQGPFGLAAQTLLAELAPAGTALHMEGDVQPLDRYGRTLSYLYLPDGRMVNEELLRAGMAVVSVYPPNVKYVDRFRAVSDSAKGAQVGLWSVSAFECLPADNRAGRC